MVRTSSYVPGRWIGPASKLIVPWIWPFFAVHLDSSTTMTATLAGHRNNPHRQQVPTTRIRVFSYASVDVECEGHALGNLWRDLAERDERGLSWRRKRRWRKRAASLAVVRAIWNYAVVKGGWLYFFPLNGGSLSWRRKRRRRRGRGRRRSSASLPVGGHDEAQGHEGVEVVKVVVQWKCS